MFEKCPFFFLPLMHACGPGGDRLRKAICKDEMANDGRGEGAEEMRNHSFACAALTASLSYRPARHLSRHDHDCMYEHARVPQDEIHVPAKRARACSAKRARAPRQGDEITSQFASSAA